MPPLSERPSSAELEELTRQIDVTPLDRTALVPLLQRIAEAVKQRGRDLDRVGGLLTDDDKAARASLGREDDRLRDELNALFVDAEWTRHAAADNLDEGELKGRLQKLLAGLRGHRDAEASLVMENASTDVGSGD